MAHCSSCDDLIMMSGESYGIRDYMRIDFDIKLNQHVISVETLDMNTGDVEVVLIAPINYCPECGRKLEVE